MQFSFEEEFAPNGQGASCLDFWLPYAVLKSKLFPKLFISPSSAVVIKRKSFRSLIESKIDA